MCCVFFPQLTVVAKDQAEPPQEVRATVVITVIRNPNGPKFYQNFYNVTVSEYRPVRSSVITVAASDKDSATVRLLFYYNFLNSFFNMSMSAVTESLCRI